MPPPRTGIASRARACEASALPSRSAFTKSARPPRADTVDDLSAPLGAAAEHDHVRTLGGERLRDRPADVAGRSPGRKKCLHEAVGAPTFR